MSKIKNENYFQVSGWMLNELGLSGNELIIYAIIHGFTQDEHNWFTGSLTYISEFAGCSKRTAQSILSILDKKGFLIKESKVVNGVLTCKYRTKRGIAEIATGYSRNCHGGIAEIAMGGIAEIATNNKPLDNKEDNMPDGKSDYTKMVDYYFAWYLKNNGMNPKFNGADGKGIKDLCEYLQNNTNGAAAFFKNILDNWSSQEKFIQNQIKPNQIYSNINQIISKLPKDNPQLKQVKPIVMKNYPNGQLYYADCLLQKQRPVKYGTGEEITDTQIDQEHKKYKVGKYQYA